MCAGTCEYMKGWQCHSWRLCREKEGWSVNLPCLDWWLRSSSRWFFLLAMLFFFPRASTMEMQSQRRRANHSVVKFKEASRELDKRP
jgi:hypothetical protein